jgi:hypothetical protein
VSYSPTIKWLIVIILPLTLAWKVLVKIDYEKDDLENDAIAFLNRHEFHVGEIDHAIDRFPIIHASSGACQMRVMHDSYAGVYRDLIRNVTAANERLIYVYRGTVYREQPTWLTQSDEYWTRLIRKFGLAGHNPRVLAVVGSPQCDMERLPWEQLQ